MARRKLGDTWHLDELFFKIGGVGIANSVFASIMLRNLKIPVEDSVMVWPPDGAGCANAEG